VSDESPVVVLFDAAGVELLVKDGVAIPANTPTIIIAGTDGTNARRIAADSIGRVGIQNQPSFDVGLSTRASLANQTNGTQKTQVVDGADILDINPSGQAAIQNPPNLDAALSTRATEVTLASIKDTDGIKKITDPVVLGAGNELIGQVKVTDGVDILDVLAEAVAVAGLKGVLIVGKTSEGNSVFQLHEADGTVVVAAKPPSAPPGTTEFVQAVDEAELSVGAGGDVASPHTTLGAIVADTVNLFLQTVNVGTEGDPAEAGAKIELYWQTSGPVNHLVERIFVAGDTKQITLPNINKARDGTVMTGDSADTRLTVTRTRLSNASQEVDFEVRGFTE